MSEFHPRASLLSPVPAVKDKGTTPDCSRDLPWPGWAQENPAPAKPGWGMALRLIVVLIELIKPSTAWDWLHNLWVPPALLQVQCHSGTIPFLSLPQQFLFCGFPVLNTLYDIQCLVSSTWFSPLNSHKTAKQPEKELLAVISLAGAQMIAVSSATKDAGWV